MKFKWAKSFGKRCREVFGDATPISAQDEHATWVNREQDIHDPEKDVLVRAAPDFHDWRE